MNLAEAVRRQFVSTGNSTRVGAEVELIVVSDGPSPRAVPPAVLRSGFDGRFVATTRPAFEPGGQLELRLAPRSTVGELVQDVRQALTRADAIAAACGVRLLAVGTNPHHAATDVPLWLASPRYVAMQQHFDEVGPDGRRMMRLTAGLQVCVDMRPGTVGREQWLVANLAGPPLSAAFANSPWLDGRPAGMAGARTYVWQGVDLRRTGYDGRHLDLQDPIGAYEAFAANAGRLSIPEAKDPVYHLQTLFPPVRPRGGYLEVRYLDAQPVERIGEAIATVHVLLTDATARRDALDLLVPAAGDLAPQWAAAAHGRSSVAAELLSIARAALDRAGHPAGVGDR